MSATPAGPSPPGRALRRGLRGFVCALALVAAATAASPAASTGDLEALRARALELVNQARLEHQVGALEAEARVDETALSHAKDMLRRDYYSHASPEGQTVQDRYVAAGGSRWRLTAENIARCAGCTSPPDVAAVERLHRGWMNSPEHRRNILARGLTAFGFAVVSSREAGLYAVQTFAGPGVPRGLEPGEAAPTAASHGEQTRIALRRINAARAAEGRAPLEQSAALTELARATSAAQRPEDVRGDFAAELHERLPEGERRSWETLALLRATCGGCGTEPTVADVRHFAEQWLQSSPSAERLRGAEVTHLGFAIAADGEGRKTAVAILGRHR